MFLMWSPAVATAIARQQTIDAVRESRRLRPARFTPEPDKDPRGRHKTRRRARAFWIVDLRNRLAH
jgi:hypothetical protein